MLILQRFIVILNWVTLRMLVLQIHCNIKLGHIRDANITEIHCNIKLGHIKNVNITEIHCNIKLGHIKDGNNTDSL